MFTTIIKIIISILVILHCCARIFERSRKKREQWMTLMLEKYDELREKQEVCAIICPEYECTAHERSKAAHTRVCPCHPRVLGYETLNGKEYTVFACNSNSSFTVFGEYKLKGHVRRAATVPCVDEWRISV
jgi:hypothetical protein